ncbi:hypothetical protein EV426DRAFT_641112 [Tirmania nivea]|nr:hypothetical protein EV426DRAFT_641112 [Tirmania nivea]
MSAEICASISTSAMDISISSIAIDPRLLEQHRLDPKSHRCREVDATDSERFQLFSHAEGHSKATQQELAQWFNVKFKKQINQSTVSRILKRFRDEPPLPEVAEMLLTSDTKRVRRVQHPELDTVLYDWFLRFEKQVPMSGDLIKEKAVIIFKALYPMDEVVLKFSNGGGSATSTTSATSTRFIAVQQDLHNLERHLAALQLRKPQQKTPITSYFQPSGGSGGSGGSGAAGAAGGAGATGAAGAVWTLYYHAYVISHRTSINSSNSIIAPSPDVMLL